MQGASRTALARLHEAIPEDGNLEQLADQLLAVVGVLAGQGSLRRVLSDPSVEADRKVTVVDSLFGAQLAEPTMALLRTAVSQRWSEPRDLVDAIEELGVDAELGVADAAGELDDVEDQLFRFERIVAGQPELRAVLTDRNLPDDRKRELLHTLLDGKVTDVTFAFLERAVIAPRGRTLERVIDDLSVLAARRRSQLVARVTTAVALDAGQQEALAGALAGSFGHDVTLQVVIDPDLVGGLTVRVGDELIDGSVARQLAEARRRLTGRSGPSRH